MPFSLNLSGVRGLLVEGIEETTRKKQLSMCIPREKAI